MELQVGEDAFLDAYVAPFMALAGDRRTGQLVGDVIRGIIGSESLICTRIAAFSPPVGGGSLQRPAHSAHARRGDDQTCGPGSG